MKSTIIFSLFAAALLASGCETTIPASDSEFPLVRISAVNEGNRIIASSDPAEVLSTDLTCGPMTELGLNVFVLRRFPTRLLLTVGDSGGVAMARAIVGGGRVSNVTPADAVVRPGEGSGDTTVIEKFYDRSDPRTGQAITFDVEPTSGTSRGPNTVFVNAVGADFSGNGHSSSRPHIGTQEGLCGG